MEEHQDQYLTGIDLNAWYWDKKKENSLISLRELEG